MVDKIAQVWNLPGSLQTAIRFHHEPSLAPKAYRPLVFIVHLGDLLAMMSGWSTGIDNMYYQLDHNYKRYLDLSFDQIATIMLKVEEEFNQGISFG